MDPIQISPEHPAVKLGKERDRLAKMIVEARDGETSKIEGAPELLRSLEREYASVDAECRLRLEEAVIGAPSGRTLAKGQSMRSAISEPGAVSLTQMVRGIGLGDWRGVGSDVRAQISSIPAAIPGAVSAGIVDLAREQSVIFKAGAQLLPIDTPSAKVARMTSEPAVQFEPESADRDLTDGAWTFDAAELTASSAWLYTTLSIEAVEDVINLDSVIQNAFAAQLALAFDEAALNGTGADQPTGIVIMDAATDRILEQLAVGTVTDYKPFVEAMGAVKAAHYEPSSVIMPVELWTAMSCMQDTDTNPLQAPKAYDQLTEYVSSFMPAAGGVGTDEITAIVGDLAALTVGVRTGITLEVSRLGAGFRKGSIEIRGYCRFGTYLTHPGALCVLRGITV